MVMDTRLRYKEDDKFVEGVDGETRVQTRDEAFNELTESLNTGEIYPIDKRHVGSTLAEVSSETTDDSFYYYVDMDGYRNISLQLQASNDSPGSSGGYVIFTVEATNQDDGTAAASCVYTDVTSDLFGVANVSADNAASESVDTFWRHSDPLPCKYLRVKVEASAASTDYWSWTIYSTKLY